MTLCTVHYRIIIKYFWFTNRVFVVVRIGMRWPFEAKQISKIYNFKFDYKLNEDKKQQNSVCIYIIGIHMFLYFSLRCIHRTFKQIIIRCIVFQIHILISSTSVRLVRPTASFQFMFVSLVHHWKPSHFGSRCISSWRRNIRQNKYCKYITFINMILRWIL